MWKGNTFVFVPDFLEYNTEYVVYISDEATDIAGNRLELYKWSFETAAQPQPPQPVMSELEPQPPTAYFKVSPNPATRGETVTFSGYGIDPYESLNYWEQTKTGNL